MKFLVTWQFHQGKLHETLSLFSQMSTKQEKSLMGNKVKLLGRWHDLVGGRGAAVFESESVEALSAYALNWNKYMDLAIAPVVDDEETKALGRQLKTNAKT